MYIQKKRLKTDIVKTCLFQKLFFMQKKLMSLERNLA